MVIPVKPVNGIIIASYKTQRRSEMNIVNALQKKRDDFIKIRDIALQQEELLTGDNVDEYISLWEKREQIRNEIEADQKKYRSDFDKTTKREREIAASINREISEAIESIMDLDKRVEALARDKREGYLTGITGLKRGRTEVKSYGSRQGQVNPRFIKTTG